MDELERTKAGAREAGEAEAEAGAETRGRPKEVGNEATTGGEQQTFNFSSV